MVSEGKGRLFKRKKPNIYLIYLPKDVGEDSMFPFELHSSIFIKIGFEPNSNRLYVKEWKE